MSLFEEKSETLYAHKCVAFLQLEMTYIAHDPLPVPMSSMC